MTFKSDDSVDAPPGIPGYSILRLLGAGGMGKVYLAVQQSLNRNVAVKVFDGSDHHSREQIARIQREAVLMAEGSHPNVVGVIDQGIVNGRAYIVMEHVEGEDLRSRLREGRPLPIDRARPILRSIAEALAALHDKGIVHRDLKPENVLFDEEGIVRVSDFGVAVHLGQVGQLTSDNTSLGTLDYMAPEQRYRLPIDARADQYSFALVAYEVLTGSLPRGVVRPPSVRNPNLPKRVDDVILRGLQEEADERFPTVTDFSEAIDESLAQCGAMAGSTGSVLGRLRRFASGVAGPPISRILATSSRRVAMFFAIAIVGAIAALGFWNRGSRVGANGPPAESAEISEKRDLVEQAGALPYRVRDDVLEVLLVRTRRDSHWTIPKATRNPETTAPETAVEEAFEEAGVHGASHTSPVGSYSYERNGKRYRVSVYPVLVEEELSTWPEQDRKRIWCSIDAAHRTVAADGLREIIGGFGQSSLQAFRPSGPSEPKEYR